MKIENTSISGVKIITPKLFGDDRGFFAESYARQNYSDVLGGDMEFVQDNVSRSATGVLRGLHFQREPHAQGKLVSVLSGSVFDVAVDIRRDSPTYGQYESVVLKAPERQSDGSWQWQQFWIEPGLAHGFVALEDETLFCYKCTDTYAPASDAGVLWNDPEIGIAWPEIERGFIISEKDREQPLLNDLTNT